MNRNHKLVSALLATLLALSLTACNDGDGNTETGTDAPAGTTAETTADANNGATQPRYDYMAADVASDVTIDRADYTGLVLTVPDSLRVDDADVRDYIEDIRFQYRTAVNGTTMVKDKPLALGDDAYIYYKGFLDGVEFEGGSNWDDAAPYTLGLGSGSFIPGFEEALVGVVPNTTSKTKPTEIHVTFPEDYGTADLAGKAVVFRIAVEYAVQYTLPDYTREFVETTLKYQPKKEFYASDVALLDEFEEYVYDYLVGQTKSGLETAMTSALWDHLTAEADCKNLPETEVDYYFGVYKSDAEYYYNAYTSYQGEAFTAVYPNLDSFAPAYFGLAADADWQAEVREMARDLVRRDMITHAIAEREGMETVTAEEFEAQVQYWISYYSAYYGTMTREDILESIGETVLREAALSEKMSTWLREQVSFTYEDGTPVVSTADNSAQSAS